MELTSSGVAFSIPPAFTWCSLHSSVIRETSKHKEASATLPRLCVPLDGTACCSTGTFFHAFVQFDVLVLSLFEILSAGTDTVVGVLLETEWPSEPNAISPAATALHLLLCCACTVALGVWLVSIPSNSVATEALSLVLESYELILLLTSLAEAFSWAGVPIDDSEISVLLICEATQVWKTQFVVSSINSWSLLIHLTKD